MSPFINSNNASTYRKINHALLRSRLKRKGKQWVILYLFSCWNLSLIFHNTLNNNRRHDFICFIIKIFHHMGIIWKLQGSDDVIIFVKWSTQQCDNLFGCLVVFNLPFASEFLNACSLIQNRQKELSFKMDTSSQKKICSKPPSRTNMYENLTK